MNHENALLTNKFHIIVDVQSVFLFHSLKHGIQYDKRASPPHPSAAVDQQRAGVGIRVHLANTSDEIEHHCAVVGHTVVRPGNEMKLNDLQRL